MGIHEQEIIRRKFGEFVLEGIDPLEDFDSIFKRFESELLILKFSSLSSSFWLGTVRLSKIPAGLPQDENYICMITDVTEQMRYREDLQLALRAMDEFYEPERVKNLALQTESLALRLNRLVEDMLDISRIRSGKITIIRERVDLKRTVEDVIRRLSPQLEASGMNKPLLEAEATFGDWDTVRIEQVVTNLLTNAIKYGKGGPIHIRISSEDRKAILSIQDFGIGIESESFTRIFDKFERAIDANDVSGLGLGLFISKEIIKAHNGNIWLTGQLDRGSTFFVELPLNCSQLNEDEISR